jgi:hypothetical protein
MINILIFSIILYIVVFITFDVSIDSWTHGV